MHTQSSQVRMHTQSKPKVNERLERYHRYCHRRRLRLVLKRGPMTRGVFVDTNTNADADIDVNRGPLFSCWRFLLLLLLLGLLLRISRELLKELF